MLGLRLINGVQVDLYQGDVETFSCDIMVVAAKALTSRIEDLDSPILDLDRAVFTSELLAHQAALFAGDVVCTDSGKLPANRVLHIIEPQEINHEMVRNFYAKCLDAFSKANARHLVLPMIGSKTDAELVSSVAMPVIAEFIAALQEKKLLRITFVLDSLENYNVFQANLFATFKED